MKNVIVFSLAFLGVCVLIYMGADIISFNQKLGLLFVFVGGCTFIGLTIDVVSHVRQKARKDNLRKLGIRN